MSDYLLPLFPLNTVLFPGVPVFLHIFEERYKEMINDCIARREPFGVVLIEKGEETGESAEPHEIGCSAEIIQVERLDDGRMNIVAVGRDRFRILSTNVERAYLQGQVENLEVRVKASKMTLETARADLQELLTEYVNMLREISEVRVNWEELPTDPLELGYLAAYVLQVTPQQKQELLDKTEVLPMLNALRHAYKLETRLMTSLVDQARKNPSSQETNFSLN